MNGYLGAVSFQFVMTWYFVFLNACIIYFSFGSIYTMIYITKDIKVHLKAMNDSVKNSRRQSQAVEQLSSCARLHSQAKQLRDSPTFYHNLFILYTIFYRNHFKLNLSLELKMVDFRLASEYSDMIQPSNMVFFTWCILEICTKMSYLQVQMV